MVIVVAIIVGLGNFVCVSNVALLLSDKDLLVCTNANQAISSCSSMKNFVES